MHHLNRSKVCILNNSGKVGIMHVYKMNSNNLDMAAKAPDSLLEFDILNLNDIISRLEQQIGYKKWLDDWNENNYAEEPPDGKIFPETCRSNCKDWTIDFMLKPGKQD